MKEEFITKDYFEKFEKKFDDFSNLVMESFAYLNVKIDEVAQRTEDKLGARIDQVESRLDAKIDAVERRLDAKIDAIDSRLTDVSINVADLAETMVSRAEHKLLKGRVQVLENTHTPA
jgi:lipid II:glycine glycyltransferase (peptidoglycan interpeptide bridge formation enzyme)